MAYIKSFLLISTLLIGGAVNGQIITTIAGGGSLGLGDGGPANACELDMPRNTALDAAGNLYIADEHSNRIRKVNAAGIITTIAGGGTGGLGDGGPATAAELNDPLDIAVDISGNVYIAEFQNNRVRKVTPSGIISTFAGNGIRGYSGDGGSATGAELIPTGIAIDGSDNVYIADNNNQVVRKVSPLGIISTFAGGGSCGSPSCGDGGLATSAEIFMPYDVAVDVVGNVYVTDFIGSIRKVDVHGIISTIAGGLISGYSGDGGPATSAKLDEPFGVAIDAANNIYIADVYNYRIRKVNASGFITTVAGAGDYGFSGDGGPATAAELNFTGVTVDAAGNIYIADDGNGRVRFVSSTLAVNTINGTDESIKIYPNPTTSQLTITAPNTINQITISNLIGQTVYTHYYNTEKAEIDVSGLPNSIYFVKVNGTEVRKFVKQ